MIRVLGLFLVAGAALSACAPVPLEEAQRGCARQIQTQGVPQNSVSIGVSSGDAWLGNSTASGVGFGFGFGSGGTSAAISTTIPTGSTPDFDAAYARCVKSRSGYAPTASLASQLQ